MGNWNSVTLKDLVPSDVATAVTDMGTLFDTVLAAYRTAIATAQAYESELAGANTDVLGILVQAVKDVLKGLLQAGKIHALFVPIPKKLGQGASPPSSLPATLADVAYSLGYDADAVGIAFSSGSNNSYQALQQQSSGGNAAFMRTVVQSLYDELDPNRPMYNNPGDAIACTVLLAGAASMSDLLKAANALNRLFRPQAAFTARMIPLPQNVRVAPITVPGATTMGVQVSWDLPKTSYSSPYFPTVSMSVKKYAVIRSTDPKAPNARNVLDFFATHDLTEGLVSTDKAKSSKVLAVGSGFNSAFVDEEVLDPLKTYYYCVAWQVGVVEGSPPAETVLDWDSVSSVQKTNIRRIPPGSKGVPPNWAAYGSVLGLFPDFAVVVQETIAEVTSVGVAGGVAKAVTDGTDALQKNIDAIASRVDAIVQQTARVTETFTSLAQGFYATSFAGLGGNAYLISELASRLNDSSDDSRPPFDSNEYVMGVVLVVGGPRMPDIQPIVDLLESFFNSPKAQDPLFGVLTSIDGIISLQEQRVFGPDVTQPILTSGGFPVDPSAPLGSPLSPSSVVDPNTGLPLPGVAGVDPNTGLPPAASPSPAISDAGVGVATSDALNPDAGFTNQPVAPVDYTTTPVETDPSPEDGKKKYTPI